MAECGDGGGKGGPASIALGGEGRAAGVCGGGGGGRRCAVMVGKAGLRSAPRVSSCLVVVLGGGGKGEGEEEVVKKR